MITCFRVTFPNLDSAKSICHSLLSEKLIACANLSEGITSIYTWKGELCEEIEVVGFFKTTPELAQQVEKRMIELHPYECPGVLSLNMNSNEGYEAWMKGCLRQND